MKHTFALAVILCCGWLCCGWAGAAQAEVRFGRNVRIGGHDVSGQTFNQKRRGEFHIYHRQPKNAGCRWARTAQGRKKVCHWKRR